MAQNNYSNNYRNNGQIHRNGRQTDRQNLRIDSILRLAKALDRDVNKIIGKPETQHTFNNRLDSNSKLELIADLLLEVRDKMEAIPQIRSSQPQPIPQQQQTYQQMQTIPQMPYNYPFMPRIMF